MTTGHPPLITDKPTAVLLIREKHNWRSTQGTPPVGDQSAR